MERKEKNWSLLLLTFYGLLAGGSMTTGDFRFIIIFSIVAAIIVLIITFYVENKTREKRGEKIMEATSLYNDFHPTVKIVNDQVRFTFSIDKDKKKILIIIADNPEEKANSFLLDYSDIISVELLEDSNLIYSKSTVRTIGGGLFGGLVAGGAGAIIGGLSGSSKEKKKVSNIKIKLLVRNLDNPSIELVCYEGEGIDVNGSLGNMTYKSIMSKAQEIIDHLNVIIDWVDKIEEQTLKQSFEPCLSVADEIEKLLKLKEKGIISAEEFQIQKKRLLDK